MGGQVAFKLTKQEKQTCDLIVTQLSQAEEAVTIVLAEYLSVLGSARDFRDGVAARLKAEFNRKSEKFRDSRQGDEAAGFCDLWENLDLDDPHLDVGHARRLEDSPPELE